MLVCTNCYTEHEDGTTVCRICGSSLKNKEESDLSQGNLPQPHDEKALSEEGPFESLLSEEPFEIEEPPKKRLVCPRCKIIYEGRETCVRCGSTLIEQAPSQEKEKPPAPEIAEVQKEEETTIPVETQLEEELLSARLHEHQAVSSPKPPPAPREAAGEAPEPSSTKRTTEANLERKVILPRKRKINFRRLPLEALSILILAVAGGYLLWSFYSHFIMKKTDSSGSSSKETIQSVTTGPSAISPSPSPSSPSSASVQVTLTETQEIEEIKGLLENIRQANLEKDIDLFMSCYATDFRNREGKKRATLDSWKNFTYLDLSFDLKKGSVSGETAYARVEWFTKISSKTGGAPQGSGTILDVTFKKEDDGWKIKEIKP